MQNMTLETFSSDMCLDSIIKFVKNSKGIKNPPTNMLDKSVIAKVLQQPSYIALGVCDHGSLGDSEHSLFMASYLRDDEKIAPTGFGTFAGRLFVFYTKPQNIDHDCGKMIVHGLDSGNDSALDYWISQRHVSGTLRLEKGQKTEEYTLYPITASMNHVGLSHLSIKLYRDATHNMWS